MLYVEVLEVGVADALGLLVGIVEGLCGLFLEEGDHVLIGDADV